MGSRHAEQTPSVQPPPAQCADAVLMVRPACFTFNPETAATNAFQQRDETADGSAAAGAEFERLASALEGEGVKVCILADSPEPPKPDAVFPNNWISFHADGTVVLYPMQAESRRRERRPDAIDAVVRHLGFKVTRTLDLTGYEDRGRYLEGTGSLVLDHRGHVAYACLSARTDPEVLAHWSGELGYEPVAFRAADRAGVPVYHTNVLMSLGERVAIVGLEAIEAGDRGRVRERLRESGREIIELDAAQIAAFAGNMLELATWDEALGECRVLVMSERARHALDPDAFARIAACTDEVLVVPVPVIERLGGGSVRCMLAEVFTPS